MREHQEQEEKTAMNVYAFLLSPCTSVFPRTCIKLKYINSEINPTFIHIPYIAYFQGGLIQRLNLQHHLQICFLYRPLTILECDM